MALTARFLLDTSAAARVSDPMVNQVIAPIVESGVVATTAVGEYDAFYGARSASQFDQLRIDRRATFEYLPTNDEHWQRALDAQFRLGQSGRHRSVGIAHLLTATIAEAHRLTVLHYDADFETAATVLDFVQRWVAKPGSL